MDQMDGIAPPKTGIFRFAMEYDIRHTKEAHTQATWPAIAQFLYYVLKDGRAYHIEFLGTEFQSKRIQLLNEVVNHEDKNKYITTIVIVLLDPSQVEPGELLTINYTEPPAEGNWEKDEHGLGWRRVELND
jgi:hypothetical protein